MIRLYQGYTLSYNPVGPLATADHFYRYFSANFAMQLQRNRTLSSSSEGALAYLTTNHRQTAVVLNYALTCENIKYWYTARKDIYPYSVDFYKLRDDGSGYVLIASKVLNTEYIQ